MPPHGPGVNNLGDYRGGFGRAGFSVLILTGILIADASVILRDQLIHEIGPHLRGDVSNPLCAITPLPALCIQRKTPRRPRPAVICQNRPLRGFNIPVAKPTCSLAKVWLVSMPVNATEQNPKPSHASAARFEIFKQQILLQYLNQTPDVEFHAAIMRQADEAARVAWFTPYPFFTFPCLFEEKARLAADHAQREILHYWSGMYCNQPQTAARLSDLLPGQAPNPMEREPAKALWEEHSKKGIEHAPALSTWRLRLPCEL